MFFFHTVIIMIVPYDPFGLRQLLHYMEETSYENAVNDDLRRIHEMVEIVKRDPETSIKYLRLLEKLNRSRKEGELEEEISTIEPIYNVAGEFAPEYDPELIYERINDTFE